ncbi:MAG: peptidoglycan DD-metalloendopeptidase family protein [Planctomycetes bacterium]|nr:peptidoglycan DD-metalloendopeptidase family protein [Planctomycetota bacterium]
MSEAATVEPLLRTVDLNVGQTREVVLSDGNKATVKLVSISDERDDLRGAVRRATATVEVNGRQATLSAGMYNLPVDLGGAQVDCAVTRACLTNGKGNAWALDADARLRLWPAGSPWVRPGTYVYPVEQRWFATQTQMANEPTFVDGVESPAAKRAYYHDGLDIGGPEGLLDVVSATDGLVVVAGDERIEGRAELLVKGRYDTVYVLDGRGWLHRYSHLKSVSVRAGRRVAMGEKLGVLGKEADSGGWSHLHYAISAVQPSGRWGTVEGYALLWQAYREQYKPKLVAIARPHYFIWTGQSVELDGSRSWSAAGRQMHYDWTFGDGSVACGKTVRRTYAKAGEYSEMLCVTDDQGNEAFDFATVQVIDREHPDRPPPGIHACCRPTSTAAPGEAVTFTVRTFGTTHGQEVWNFGDGTPTATTKSDGNVEALAKDGYAVIEHRYEKPGRYIVTVSRSDEHGQQAVAHLVVYVGHEH